MVEAAGLPSILRLVTRSLLLMDDECTARWMRVCTAAQATGAGAGRDFAANEPKLVIEIDGDTHGADDERVAVAARGDHHGDRLGLLAGRLGHHLGHAHGAVHLRRQLEEADGVERGAVQAYRLPHQHHGGPPCGS